MNLLCILKSPYAQKVRRGSNTFPYELDLIKMGITRITFFTCFYSLSFFLFAMFSLFESLQYM